MSKKLIILHGGGPTAVINASLYGAIKEAKENKNIDKIYVAIGGTGGLINRNIKDITDISGEQLKLLLQSSGSAIGSSRDALYENEYEKILNVLQEYGINYVLLNGGNGTMDTCGKLYEYCKDKNIFVMGIPKTIDNDISITDHCPGFGSAARYMAGSIAEICADVASLPIHITIVEAFGRNAGWLSAASAMSTYSYKEGADLIYFPEISFNEETFLNDISNLIDRKGHGVVVVSEGITDINKNLIAEPIFKADRAVYFGDVSEHLAKLITSKLKVKTRSEKPGLFCRASVAWQSDVDLLEAIECGKRAVRAVVNEISGKMIAIKRISSSPYEIEYFLVDIKEVMMYEKTMPREFINKEGNYVTEDFKLWCKPLIGLNLPKIIDLR